MSRKNEFWASDARQHIFSSLHTEKEWSLVFCRDEKNHRNWRLAYRSAQLYLCLDFRITLLALIAVNILAYIEIDF